MSIAATATEWDSMTDLEPLEDLNPLLRRTKVEVVDPLLNADWDKEIAGHPDATIFHSSAWARVLGSTYGHKPKYLRLSANDEIMAMLPVMEVNSVVTGRRGVSLPFTDACGPLIFSQNEGATLLSMLSRMAAHNKWKSFEIRGGSAPGPAAVPAMQFREHKLDLRDGKDALFENLESSVRRAIRKAERCDVRCKLSRSEKSMEEFYRLHVHTRRHHGLPPQPMDFFRNIQKEVISRDLGVTSIATFRGRPVAAGVFLFFGRNALFKFGASNRNSQHLRPNNLVLWEAIRSLAEQGLATFSFGRTSLDNEGLRRFKLSWGTTEETISYYRFDSGAKEWVTAADNVAGFHNAMFSRMPLFLNRMMGKIIYPHLD